MYTSLKINDEILFGLLYYWRSTSGIDPGPDARLSHPSMYFWPDGVTFPIRVR